MFSQSLDTLFGETGFSRQLALWVVSSSEDQTKAICEGDALDEARSTAAPELFSSRGVNSILAAIPKGQGSQSEGPCEYEQL